MKKKSIAVIIAIAVILTCAVGGTLAWLVATTNPVVNTFTPGKVTSEVHETLKNGVKSNVTVQNTGNVNALIRAAIVVNWADKDGNISGTPVTADDYTMSLNDTDWTQKSDGYYYYNGVVAPNNSTSNLINTCTPVEGKAPTGYALQVTILAEAIQAEGGDGTQSASQAAWGYSYGTSGWTE